MSDVDNAHLPDVHDGASHHADEEAEPLGAIDAAGWGAALLGAGIAVLLVIALYVASQG